jgi:nucleoside-diphosphate-sugar epimerase
MSSVRVLITGATGFLGRGVVRETLIAGLPMRTTGRAENPDPEPPHYHRCDLADGPPLDLLAGVGTVIHCAGLAHQFDRQPDDAERFHRGNVEATERLARAAVAAGVRRFVHVSSVSVYGPGHGCRDESAATCPQGHYAESKLTAERRLIEIFGESGTELVVLRLGTLYGEGDPGNVLRLIQAIDRGRFLPVGRGRNGKSLIHRDDAARACLLAAMQPLPGDAMSAPVYNVTARPHRMAEIVARIHRTLGRTPPPLFVPGPLVTAPLWIAAAMPGLRPRASGWLNTARKWLADDAYDGRRFIAAFGFRAFVSLSEGLTREVAWYRSQQPEPTTARRAA